MKLIDDWKRAWRLWSVQIFAVIAVLPDIWQQISALGLLDGLPHEAVWVFRVLGVIGVVCRVVQQGGRHDRQHP